MTGLPLLSAWRRPDALLLALSVCASILLGLDFSIAPVLPNLDSSYAFAFSHAATHHARWGSDFISTNTFGGTRNRLKLDNLEDRVAELNEAGARLAREAAGEALVAGSVGPTGELMEPLGTLTMDGARESFAEQARALKAGGVDFALIETMSALEEVQSAIEGVREAGLPVVVTMSFDTNFRTMMGIKPVAAVTTIAGWGVSVIGANCGNGPAEIERVMSEMAKALPEGVALMAKSNAGMPRWLDGHITYDGTPEVMSNYARRMAGLGVRVIGGCCGSTPEHIAGMRKAIDALS